MPRAHHGASGPHPGPSHTSCRHLPLFTKLIESIDADKRISLYTKFLSDPADTDLSGNSNWNPGSLLVEVRRIDMLSLSRSLFFSLLFVNNIMENRLRLAP